MLYVMLYMLHIRLIPLPFVITALLRTWLEALYTKYMPMYTEASVVTTLQRSKPLRAHTCTYSKHTTHTSLYGWHVLIKRLFQGWLPIRGVLLYAM